MAWIIFWTIFWIISFWYCVFHSERTGLAFASQADLTFDWKWVKTAKSVIEDNRFIQKTVETTWKRTDVKLNKQLMTNFFFIRLYYCDMRPLVLQVYECASRNISTVKSWNILPSSGLCNAKIYCTVHWFKKGSLEHHFSLFHQHLLQNNFPLYCKLSWTVEEKLQLTKQVTLP